MPTTSRGNRYPASSSAPNVPQDIQNLAADVDSKFTRFNQYTVGWPSTTIAGTNNIGSSTITVPAQSGPYLLVVFINCLITATASAGVKPNLQMIINGSIKSQDLYTGLSATGANYTAGVHRPIYVSSGASQTVQGRVDIPAGATCTTYTDDTHSYVSAFTIPMW